ncbi:hypothetical protein WMY93_015236 [Mugilogobius chulae]|uniref:Beta/gamma crystallin 'Greek key' domain-containing protein n=1 Tax=Mugilogobius chulae TaxID=88201 RepID=A0AAW0NU70_9GOBI
METVGVPHCDSDSENPEEQPNSSGVLGRIGSWLWSRSSTSSGETPSPTCPDQPGAPESLSEDVFYPVSQSHNHPSGDETPEDEWEEASSSFHPPKPNQEHHFSRESQAGTGKKIHVYLEETSISGNAGQETETVTKYAKSLQVRPKSRSSVSLDAENRHSSFSSALVGVSLQTQRSCESLDEEMGRKHGRRRSRKNSQGDEKSSSNKEATDKDLTKSPKSKEASDASKTAPPPAEFQSGSSGCEQGLNSALACGGVAVEEVNMEETDSLYRVERKTETPESKRRSMKVSRSEVKLFTKNVPLRAEHKVTIGGKSDLRRREGIPEEQPVEDKLEDDKKPDDKPKPSTGRIADKISIFENQTLGTPGQFNIPRSADVSPMRKPAGRLKTDITFSDERTKRRSSSSSPPRDRVMTIKDRVRNFTEACNSTAPGSPKQNITRIHRKVSASKSLELLDFPDEPLTKEKAVAKIVLQLNGGDANASAGNLKNQSPKEMTEKEQANEATDTVDSGKMLPKTETRTRRRKSKDLLSPKSENKLEINNLDVGQKEQDGSENVAKQVSDSVLSKSQDKLVNEIDTSCSQTKKPIDGDPVLPQKEQETAGQNTAPFTTGTEDFLTDAKARSKDDWSASQNVPSSWLDLDYPKPKLKPLTEAKLTSSGSENNLLDTSAELDDDDFVEKIKKLCAPFMLPPRKHNSLRAPQPPFAMPAIKEDRFEKTFDPEEFTFGLRKKKQISFEMPSLLAKLQNSDEKPSIKPARASLAERSMLLGGFERFRDKKSLKDEKEEDKDEIKDEIKVKSRLEGSCVLNSLTTSSFRSKLSQSQPQAESTNSGNVSPQQTSPQQLGPPPPEAGGEKEEIQQAEEAVESDSGPPLPTFSQIKLPDFLEKRTQREAKEQGQRGTPTLQPASTKVESDMSTVTEAQKHTEQLQVHTQVVEEKPTVTESVQKTEKELQEHHKAAVKMPSPVEPSVKTPQKLPDSLPNHFSGISLKDKPTSPVAPLKRRLSNKLRPAKGFHKRPGKMLLYEKAPLEGQVYEVHRDVEDATSMLLSALVSVRVIRGCWVLYEKPGFQGRTIALEEGALELSNIWAQPDPEPGTEPGLDPQMLSDQPLQIGSIRLAVSDYSIPHIDLFTEPEGGAGSLLTMTTPWRRALLGFLSAPRLYKCTLEYSGVPDPDPDLVLSLLQWLVFSDPGFQGMLAVLETGVYPFPEAWGFPSPFVGSLRPLKMGGFKVENHNEIKALVYEQAGFEGPCLETETDVFCFGEEEGGQDTALQCVGSLKILGGLWVGYSEPGFEGQQYILEEGEYLDCQDWGGAEILSLRPIMADFMSPHVKMFSDRDFGALGVNIDLTVPVINMEETGYGLKTQSVDVLSGVWVVFEQPGFSGESFLLEKGQYGSPEDWGSARPTIASAMPVLLENFENAAKFKVQLFPDADFHGSPLLLEDSEGSLPPGFSVGSCKVLAGSWVAYEGQDFSGRMYVLDEGSYPDLRAMGCVDSSATILSMQVTGFEFSLPSVVLFERIGLKGKRLVLNDGEVNLLMSGGGGRVQSVMVEGGMCEREREKQRQKKEKERKEERGGREKKERERRKTKRQREGGGQREREAEEKQTHREEREEREKDQRERKKKEMKLREERGTREKREG